MTQSAYLLGMFASHHNVLTTTDLISDIHTAAEYRRILCDLDKKGYVIQREKVGRNLWKYRLTAEPMKFEVEPDGQMRMAI